MALTPKQDRFVAEYLVDLNATQAAIRAGYAKKSAAVEGCRLLTNANVVAKLQQARKALEERTEITQERVLAELAKIGFSDIRKVMRWGNTAVRVVPGKGDDDEGELVPYHGLALIDSSEIDDSTAAAISEVSQGKEGLKVKMHDKKGALVDIGRHLGMFAAEKDRDSSGQPQAVYVVGGPPDE